MLCTYSDCLSSFLLFHFFWRPLLSQCGPIIGVITVLLTMIMNDHLNFAGLSNGNLDQLQKNTEVEKKEKKTSVKL